MNRNSSTEANRSGPTDNGNSGWKDMLAGSISGGMTRMIIAPLDVLKIRFQVQVSPSLKGEIRHTKYHYSGIIDSVQTILRKEGILAFWNGNLLAEMLYISYSGAQFGAYSFIHTKLLERLPPERRQSSHAQVSFASGGLAAIAAITVTYPLDLLRTRFAAQAQPRTYTTISEAIRMIYATDGIRGFYSGWGPTSISLVPSMAIQFSVYDWAKRSWFGGRSHDSPLLHAIAGALSGIVSKLAVLPLDVMKRQLQVQGLYHHQEKMDKMKSTPASVSSTGLQRYSLFALARRIYKYEGIAGFFKGAVPSALKAGASASLTFTFYEQSKVFILYALRRTDAQ